jgi:2-amino-4-hydroxy-6-hydroxymethyldihydropteridine diphosphokinase
MSLAYLGFGSNLGDKISFIEKGLLEIGKRGIGNVLRRSRMYQTAPVGVTEGCDFVNCAVELTTDLAPRDLLKELRTIEESQGRQRTRDKNSPRTLDIDILFYGHTVISEPDLKLPHPEIASRLFLLTTLKEIRPDLLHPVLHKTVSELLAEAPAAVLQQRITPL